jgi:hypothetical protein
MFGEIGCRMRTSEIRGLLLGRERRVDGVFGKEIEDNWEIHGFLRG